MLLLSHKINSSHILTYDYNNIFAVLGGYALSNKTYAKKIKI